MDEKLPYIKVTKDGPYMVYGTPKIVEEIIEVDKDGISVCYAKGREFKISGSCGDKCTALCRCGNSKNAPYCDGTHQHIEWDGDETASFGSIVDEAESFEGPNYVLKDNENYCAFARFCDASGRVWNLIRRGNEETDKTALREAWNCPAGRLMIFDKKGKQIEPDFEKEIGILEDSGIKISGPLFIKGKIRVESEDGKSYEVRNRQTLCRCGYSSNKPFCNGAHASAKWKADYSNK